MDVASIDKEGRTPLHYAALANDADVVSRLLAGGADPNAADRLGFTPLHFAAQEGAITPAQLLLAAGAQVDAANSYGNTPPVHGCLQQPRARRAHPPAAPPRSQPPAPRTTPGKTRPARPASSRTTTSPSSLPTLPTPTRKPDHRSWQLLTELLDLASPQRSARHGFGREHRNDDWRHRGSPPAVTVSERFCCSRWAAPAQPARAAPRLRWPCMDPR
jgi:ankyrin repeat protein